MNDRGDKSDASGERGPSFKTFWKDKVQRPLSFIQHDPNSKGKQKAPAQSDEDGEGKPGRRQQVYRAQKLHRQRKADYVKHLEQQIENLRKLETSTRGQKLELEAQNNMIRQVLNSYGISAEGEVSTTADAYATAQHQFIPFDVHYDSTIGQERVFAMSPFREGDPAVALPDSSTSATNGAYCSSMQEYFSILDFVLALEHVCKDHMEHPASYTTNSQNPAAEGHMLTTSTRALGYAPMATTLQSGANWEVPYVEIDKLIHFSEALDLQEEITPVQAWQTLKLWAGKEIDMGALQQMKMRLAQGVKCYGFGAVIDIQQYWRVVNDVTGISSGDLISNAHVS